MTDPTTTPPPEGTTEPRCEHTEHATRGDGRYGRHFETADPAGAWEPCPSPPVSAVAPDERVCYSDECGEPCQSWQAMKRAEIEHLRRENATIAQRLGEARAALAARPAPVVSDLLPAESIALTVALAQVQRGDDPSPNVAGMCVLALARLAGRHDWTVADAPAADEGERTGR